GTDPQRTRERTLRARPFREGLPIIHGPRGQRIPRGISYPQSLRPAGLVRTFHLSMKNSEVALEELELKEHLQPRQEPTPNRQRDLLDAQEVRALQDAWRHDPRWHGVTRKYTADKVLRLRGSVKIEHTIADRMSRKLWHLLNTEPYVNALGALSGN